MEHFERQALAQIEGELAVQSARLDDLRRILQAIAASLGILIETVVAKSLIVYFIDSKGEILMPATLPIGATATATAHEFSGLNGTGAELPLAGVISWVSSDPTIATVDPSSGLVTSVAAGTATITATDAANGLTGSDVVSDTALVAQSLTVVITPN